MNKKSLVAAVGTLALMLNVLLPSVAFGQTTGTQTGTQQIDCGTEIDFSLPNVPDAVTFDVLTATDSAQWSWDGAVDADSALPVANRLEVSDQRSGNVDGCPTVTPGFQVTAEITTTLTNGTTTIADSQFRVVTSNEITFNDCLIADGEEVCYGVGTSGSGNLHDVDAPVLYDDVGRLVATVYDCFDFASRGGENRPYVYASTTGDSECNTLGSAFTNSLDSAVVLMTSSTSHNQVFETGVVLTGLIPANQDPGTYVGTITYTLSKV